MSKIKSHNTSLIIFGRHKENAINHFGRRNFIIVDILITLRKKLILLIENPNCKTSKNISITITAGRSCKGCELVYYAGCV